MHLMTGDPTLPCFASNIGSIAGIFQPGSDSAARGGTPRGGLTGIVISPCERRRQCFHERCQRLGWPPKALWYKDAADVLKMFSTGAISIILPAYMTPTLSARYPTTLRSWEIKIMVKFSSRCKFSQ